MPHKGKVNDAGDSILGTTKTSLQMLQQVAGTIPVPGISVAVGSALQVINVIEAIKTNREDREALIKRITELMLVIVVPLKGKNPKTFPQDLVENVGHLSSTLSQIMEDLRVLQEANLFQTLLNYTAISGKIKACSAKLDWAVRHFQVHDVISNAISLFRLLDFARDALIETMPRAKSASHRSGRPGAPAPCFKGTRAEILGMILNWATDPDENAPGIFWLTGVAGIGKSTIAQSIALLAYEEGYLGASYFFSRRGEAELSDPRKFFPTLAYDLAGFDIEFAKHLGDSLGGRTDVCYHSYQEQAQKLFIEPLQLISKRKHPVLIVIDALDECQRDGIRAIIPLLIATQALSESSIRILFTGRPEPHLRAAFNSSVRHQQLVLHDAELALVQSDIKLYLADGLQSITAEFSTSVQDSWCKVEELDRLVENAKGLFVYAYTALCFIGDPLVRHPPRQLSTLLTNRIDDDKPYSVLDKLYTEIINSSLQCDSSNYVTKRFLDVVGVLVFRRDALSIEATDALLGEGEFPSYAGSALEGLRSIIVVPSNNQGAAQIYHESFRDYITTPSRCPSVTLISKPIQEERLAIRCFLVMKSLLKNGVAVRTGSEVAGTVEINSLPQHLTYACRFWASHLSSAPSGNAEIVELLHNFASFRILWWLEVMSHTQNIPSAIKALTDAGEWAVNSGCSESLVTLLKEAYRFTCAFRQPLSVAPIHIYTSAITFCPRETVFWKTYCVASQAQIRLTVGNPWKWSACISTFYGHTDAVNFVAFSRDGGRLASASDDNTIRIWDVATGASMATLQGHTDSVQLCAFSPDDACLTSGSVDGTIRTWDVASGVGMRTMQVHTLGVHAFALSPDASKLASASRDHVVRIWDVMSGASMATLQGHNARINTLAFSPDGAQLASGLRDNTIQLWNVDSGAPQTVLQGHMNDVNTVAFSPNGSQLASGSDDKTIRIWNVVSGACMSTMHLQARHANGIMFSRDGSQLASGSSDGTVCIWDVESGGLIDTLDGHTGQIDTVAFSPNGSRLVSGSRGKAIRIWDVSSRARISTMRGEIKGIDTPAFLPNSSEPGSKFSDNIAQIESPPSQASTFIIEGHTKGITAIAFSPDGAHLASGSMDNTIRLWDVISGSSVVLHGHNGPISTLVFSPDSTRIASGSSDNTIQLWDVSSGASITVLKGHTDDVKTIAFSLNGSRLASGSDDETVRMWDVASGACMATMLGHTRDIYALAFSSQGSTLASASYDGHIWIWDVASGVSIGTLHGHEGPVNAIVFSQNDSKMATGSEDETVRIWDVASGASITIHHTEPVRGVAFSQDGAALWVTSETKIFMHDLATDPVDAQDDQTPGILESGQGKSKNWSTEVFDNRPPGISPVFYKDYWLRSRKDGRLISHIPADYPVDTHQIVSHGNVVAAGCSNGRVLILQVSDSILNS